MRTFYELRKRTHTHGGPNAETSRCPTRECSDLIQFPTLITESSRAKSAEIQNL